MGHALAQVVFVNASNLPEDQTMNTFHFETGGAGVTAGDATDIADALEEFYNDAHAPIGTAAIATHISTLIQRALCSVRVYDMDDPTPRVPILVQGFTLGAAVGAVNHPNEVALVLSFRGASVAGIPPARTRGRIYLGPLNNTEIVNSTGDVRPTAAISANLAGAGRFLANHPTLEWCVFSPTALAGGDPTGLFAVLNGFVDNAFDTQRRRGRAATGRTLFP